MTDPDVVVTPVNKKKSGDYVTVFCKLPHGLKLRGFELVTGQEVVGPGTYREVKVAQPVGGEFLVRGVAAPYGQAPRAMVTEAGYAITPNCPRDLWDNWFAANQKSPMVVNRLIYAERTTARGVAEGRDYARLTSGMEPMKPDGDPRAPRPRSGISVVGTAEESRSMVINAQIEAEALAAQAGEDA